MGRLCIGRRREGEDMGKDELMSPRLLRWGVGPADLSSVLLSSIIRLCLERVSLPR